MSEITVASTTDTQESVDRAAGLNSGGTEVAGDEGEQIPGSPTRGGFSRGGVETQSVPAEDESEAESETVEEQGDRVQITHGESGQAGDRETEGQQPGKPGKGGMQKRIDTLTRKLYRQQEDLDALRESVAKPQTQPNRPPATNARPVVANFNSFEQYVDALVDWSTGQRLDQQKQTELVQAEQERVREVFDTYNNAAQSARVKYDDFEDVVGRKDLKIPQSAQLAIIEAGEIGPDIAYYLGKHPDLCHELADMSPMRAVAKIGQIEAAIQGTGGKQQGIARAPVASRNLNSNRPQDSVSTNRKPVTSAPAPIAPVGGSSSKSAVPLAELPYRDYKRLRDQEERARYR